ncbi:hypothetical protein FQN53_003723 [Emmonsiellopsis sp. PD_33]|nr:hypothetical protein FQN53_003723 [Emmonsiellopsis sp. PD_33]
MAGKDGDKANPTAEDKGKGKASSTPQERTPAQTRSAPGDINAQILQIQRRAEQVRQSTPSRTEQPSSSNSAANPRSPATTTSTKTVSTSSRSSAGPRSPAVGAASRTPTDRDVTSNTAVAVSESSEAPTKKKRKTRRGKKKRKTPPEVDGQTTVGDGSGSESDEASIATTEPALSTKSAGKRPMMAAEGSNGSTATQLAGADSKGDSGVLKDISNGVSTPVKKEEQKATQPDTSGSGNGTKNATHEASGKDDQSPIRGGSVGREEEALTALGSGKGPTYAGVVRRSSRMGVPANRQEEPIDETSILSTSPSRSSSRASSRNAVSKDDTSRRSSGSVDINSREGENDKVDAEQKKLLTRYRKETENLREQLEGQSTDLWKRDAEIHELTIELNDLRRVEGDLRQRIRAQELDIASAGKENSQLNEDLTGTTTSLDNVIKDVKAKSKILAQIEKEMEQLRNENKELKEENKANLARFDKYEVQCKELMNQVVNSPLREENAKLKSENEEARAELGTTRQHLQDLQAEQADLRKQVRKGNGKRKPSALSLELAELTSKKEEVDETEKNDSCTEICGEERSASMPSEHGSAPVYDLNAPATIAIGRSSQDMITSPLPSASSTPHSSIQTPKPLGQPEDNESKVAETNARLDASTQTCLKSCVSSSTQTAKIERLEIPIDGKTSGAAHIGVNGRWSVQKGKAELAKPSIETKTDAHASEVKDASVQATEQTISSPQSRSRRFLMFLFIIVVWVMIILWGQDEESLWLEANDISRAAFVGTRDRTLGPFPWLETLRFDLIVWMQIDRVLPG